MLKARHAAAVSAPARNRGRFRPGGGRAARAHPASIPPVTRAALPAMTPTTKSCCASCRPCRSASAPPAIAAPWCSCAPPRTRRRSSSQAHWEGSIARSSARARRLRLRPALRRRRRYADRRRDSGDPEEPAESPRAGPARPGRQRWWTQPAMIDPRQVPLALYVHLPWCVRKCPYCDFNSHAVPASGLPEQAYLHALLEDLEFAAEEAQTARDGVGVLRRRHAEPVFVELDRQGADAGALAVACRGEPRGYAGSESRNDRARPLHRLRGRWRQPRLARRAKLLDAQARLARPHSFGRRDRQAPSRSCAAAGLENFNLDLMYALPEQSVDEALHDLARAVALQPGPYFALPADARAGHAVCEATTGELAG